ncbi:hypothetical protein H6G00_01585 [Leptolyngbya sp. FACHB-541]|uniref:hypothetical protein n=1 Tax=Leptolyngbya sp. FACHB-541 TaxID=2692810 RepID=UPI00168386CC|nr:hypothetical protein [Leptolyngbya sp. FACHB-541]MBD1995322.1 hypothetical protein [Leptolyngbya sp. FACHB-541]
MDRAFSVRHLDWVYASACDYKDYKYLGLKCLECDEAVFLKAQLQDEKTFAVKPHFSHFPSKDPAAAQRCKKRVSRYSPEDLQRISAKGKGQRLKLIQRWFWQVVSNRKIMTAEGLKTIAFCQQHFWQSIPAEKHLFTASFDNFTKAVVQLFTMKDREALHEAAVGLIQRLEQGDWATVIAPLSIFDQIAQEDFKRLQKSVELRMHKTMVTEILDFLAAPKQQHILHELAQAIASVCAATALEAAYLAQVAPLDAVMFVSARRDRLTEERQLCAAFLMELIALTPWAEEFSKLQK